jgi:hypothetical protein
MPPSRLGIRLEAPPRATRRIVIGDSVMSPFSSKRKEPSRPSSTRVGEQGFEDRVARAVRAGDRIQQDLGRLRSVDGGGVDLRARLHLREATHEVRSRGWKHVR